MSSTSKGKVRHWKKIAICLMLYDIIAVNVAHFLALWLRFDCHYSEIPSEYITSFMWSLPVYTVICLCVFWFLRLYSGMWRFASYTEFSRVVLSTFVTAVLHIISISALGAIPSSPIVRMPISYYIFGMFLQFAAILAVRFSYRIILMIRDNRQKVSITSKRIMLIGAGAAGRLMLQSINNTTDLGERVCCIIDDNPNKWNRDIDGVPIVGGRDNILKAVETYKIDKICLAIPSATAEQIRDILNICKETKCELKKLPSVYQLVNYNIGVSNLKEVAIEDLLGRDVIHLDMTPVCDMLYDKTVLVTGGGGSIGSELCRQIAKLRPKKLIIFDVYENNAYSIQQELIRKYEDLDLSVLIGSVRDSGRLKEIFEKYKPQIVYHAAAHKHVPLMEGSPCEAIKNNAIGTYKVAYAAMKSGCERFVLISTDKAVNPTNIMGASKRLCEMIVQTFDYMVKNGRTNELPDLHAHMTDGIVRHSVWKKTEPKTRFCAVRFGNVLGSNGSVIPLFKKQIEDGGPVTVTHPDIIRYFMLISEACSLVLRASVMGRGSEIYVLDMGEPVKIDTLARNLIKLSGKVPDKDIQIIYTGLRPGEKLYEEKLMEEEGLEKTENNKIHIGRPIPFDYDQFLAELKMLMNVAYDEDEQEIYSLVRKIVATFHPDEDKCSDDLGIAAAANE